MCVVVTVCVYVYVCVCVLRDVSVADAQLCAAVCRCVLGGISEADAIDPRPSPLYYVTPARVQSA